MSSCRPRWVTEIAAEATEGAKEEGEATAEANHAKDAKVVRVVEPKPTSLAVLLGAAIGAGLDPPPRASPTP